MEELEPPELRMGDKVRIKNFEKKPELNGLTGYIMSAREAFNMDTEYDWQAMLPGNKYGVSVAMPNQGRQNTSKPGFSVHREERKQYKLKRDNLQLVEGSIQTYMGMFENSHVPINYGGRMIASPEVLDMMYPESSALLNAVMSNNVTVVRSILEQMHDTRGVPPADAMVDAAGNTPLIGAIERGYLDVINVLFEYGANPNAEYGPMIAEFSNQDLSALHFAIRTVGLNPFKSPNCPDIVLRIIEAGADVNIVSSSMGSPLSMASSGDWIKPNQWEFRLKLVKSLLAHGATPTACYIEQANIIMSPIDHVACNSFWGSEENRLEVLELFLQHGADPGELSGTPGMRMKSCLHTVANRRLWRTLEVLLKSEKGCAAVNTRCVQVGDEKDGCTPLLIALRDPKLDSTYQSDTRRCIAILFQYGGDVNTPNAQGCPPYLGLLNTTNPTVQELRRLVDNVHGDVFEYWSSEEVQEWVGKVSSTKLRCPVCLVWSDMQRSHNQTEFKVCARCGKQYYCSRKCQKAHWKQHKKECRPIS